jgi:hypothetical protein
MAIIDQTATPVASTPVTATQSAPVTATPATATSATTSMPTAGDASIENPPVVSPVEQQVVEATAAKQVVDSTPGATENPTAAQMLKEQAPPVTTATAATTKKAADTTPKALVPKVVKPVTPVAKKATTATTAKATTTKTTAAKTAATKAAAAKTAAADKTKAAQKIADDVGKNNPWWQKLEDMTFAYDPATDADYQNSAKVMENQIAQMMVGRGGLYSSVMQSALSTKLIELQLGMRKEKYNEYLNERNFNLSMANTVFQRQDTEWQHSMTEKQYAHQVANDAFNQKMSVLQYKANREDAAFSKSMQQQQLSMQRAQVQAQKQANNLAQQQVNAVGTINTKVAQYQTDKSKYNAMVKKWQTNGKATGDVAAYFGVPAYTDIKLGLAQGSMILVAKKLSSDKKNILSLATQYNQAEVIAQSYYDFMKTPTTADQKQENYQYDENGKLISKTTIG